MATNADTSIRTVLAPPREVHMSLFDDLPEEIRKVLTSANQDYSAYQIYRALELGDSPEFVINAIRNADVTYAAAYYEGTSHG